MRPWQCGKTGCNHMRNNLAGFWTLLLCLKHVVEHTTAVTMSQEVSMDTEMDRCMPDADVSAAIMCACPSPDTGAVVVRELLCGQGGCSRICRVDTTGLNV